MNKKKQKQLFSQLSQLAELKQIVKKNNDKFERVIVFDKVVSEFKIVSHVHTIQKSHKRT